MGDPVHRARLEPHEKLLFEAGIKLGGIFHQYLGTPVSPRTAATLARAIEHAVRLQPFVTHVSVSIRPAAGGPVGRGRFGYRYLTAEMLHVRVTLSEGRSTVSAELVHRPDLRYPLMRVLAVRPSRVPRGPRRRAKPVRRAGRAGRT